jgi:hypothetical protein
MPLIHLFAGTVISVATGGSDSHEGVVLQQLHGTSWRPLAFFSRCPPPSKNTQFDRKLLAVIFAICFLFDDWHFRVLTDDKHLASAVAHHSPP